MLRKMIHQAKKLSRDETTIPQPVQHLPRESKKECKLCKSQPVPAMQGFPSHHPLLWQLKRVMFQKQLQEMWIVGLYCSSTSNNKIAGQIIVSR